MLSALAPLRRRVALALAPELQPVAAPCDGPMPVFRSVRIAPQAPAEPQTRKRPSPEMQRYSTQVRRLDGLYTALTGVVLHWRTAPDYTGPLYQWRISRVLVRDSVIKTLLRLRSNQVRGIHSNSHYLALNYFDAIWPADAPWPSDIPRPSATRGAA